MSSLIFNEHLTKAAKRWFEGRWFYLLTGFTLGLLSLPTLQMIFTDLTNLLTGLVPEAIGITFTVLILERFSRRRERNRQREQDIKRIIREMGSPSAAEGVRAAREAEEIEILHDGTLEGAVLLHANLEGAVLTSANLHRAFLTNAVLRSAALNRGNLREARLVGADLHDVSLRQADLRGATLTGANLQRVKLGRADLRGANLVEANLQQARLAGADLRGAVLFRANLRGAILERTLFDEHTTLPDGRYWSPQTDMVRFTHAEHLRFWQPKWAKEPYQWTLDAGPKPPWYDEWASQQRGDESSGVDV